MAAEGLQGSSSLGEVHLSALSLSPERKEPLWETAPLCSHTHKGKAAVSKEPASNSTPEPLRRHRTETMGRGSTAGPPAGSSVPVCLVGTFPRAHSGTEPTTCEFPPKQGPHELAMVPPGHTHTQSLTSRGHSQGPTLGLGGDPLRTQSWYKYYFKLKTLEIQQMQK